MNNPIVLTIDDHLILKDGIEKRLKQIFPDVQCFFANSVKKGLSILYKETIHLVLTDLEFTGEPGFDGFYFLKAARNQKKDAKVIALTNHSSYSVLRKVRKAGFNSFLLKSCSLAEFEETLYAVLYSDEEYLSTSMKNITNKRKELRDELFDSAYDKINRLSKRELEVVILSAETIDRNILSEKLNCSPFTIDAYYKRIYEKLNIKSKNEIKLFAKEYFDEIQKKIAE